MQTAFYCQSLIEFDAAEKYQSEDIGLLITETISANHKKLVVIKNTHRLTTKASVYLYKYLKAKDDSNTIFFLISDDRLRMFPPLLEYLEVAESNLSRPI